MKKMLIVFAVAIATLAAEAATGGLGRAAVGTTGARQVLAISV